MRVACLILVVMIILLLGFLGFSRNETVTPLLPSLLKNDKLLHFGGFLFLSCTLYFIWDLGSIKWNLAITSCIMFITCIASEIIQSLLPVILNQYA